MTEFSPQQQEALEIAHMLADLGAPIFNAYPNHGDKGGEFIRPNMWQHTDSKYSHRQVELWKPGNALCMVTGVVYDVIDVDPRNGGEAGIEEIAGELDWDAGDGPIPYGTSQTPSYGEHLFIGRTGLRKCKAGPGIDLQAGDRHGEGRGYVYIAPTVRLSKYGPNAGQEVMYKWIGQPELRPTDGDPGLARFVEYVQGLSPTRAAKAAGTTASAKDAGEDWYDETEAWTSDAADALIEQQEAAIRDAKPGEINSTLGGAARVLGRFVAGGYLEQDRAESLLLDALTAGGQHSDSWNVANGLDWTAATVIAAGLANGQEEPWTVQVIEKSEPASAPAAAKRAVDSPGQSPRMEVISAGDSAYWLQNMLGTGALSGFFSRAGQVVHTPLMNELGYVQPAIKGDDNGPAQIQAVSAGQLAAKVQYAYSWYKTLKSKKDEDSQERVVPAVFPMEAARRAVDAPEAMANLRTLNGLTMTPIVRADGTVLDRPGYDQDSGYLYLPDRSVRVEAVPDSPSDVQVSEAVGLLMRMLAEFPWDSDQDKANYLGLLLTPLLRLIAPPAYKMFGISAHQPGSGKTLLADIASILHGGVFRSEVPQEEPELAKLITSILWTTSSPVVVVDNVTGVLKSSKLAGLLTSDVYTDRLLGRTENVAMVNDRLWIFTGNNLSLGGDLVRRTVTVMIDPDQADPETRSFAIPDLKGWVRENRNNLLHALLVMIRHWSASGAVEQARRQSDSYARWERVVGGILAACGVPGGFDEQSGKRAARGGDDDGLGDVLAHLRDTFGDRRWTAREALSPTVSTAVGDFIAESRHWLPASVLDKLARSEVGGVKSFGRWLLNRTGRWVTAHDGRALVLREHGRDKHGILWSVDQA